MSNYKDLIQAYFKDYPFVDSNIQSFNDFVDKQLQKLVDEIGDIVPTIIPQEVESFVIKLKKIWIEKPSIVEADGSKREVYPSEARLKYCNLHGLKREELISKGEDPNDPGGYFIINGNERVLITVEDLASNRLFIEHKETGPSEYVAKVFSEMGSYRVPHTLERMKDGLFYLTFTRFKRIPLIPILKGLGLSKDQDIIKLICGDKSYDSLFINL